MKRTFIHQLQQVGLTAVAVVIPLLAPWSAGSAHAVSAAPGTCNEIQLPVALAPDQPADQTISGTLCIPLWWSSPNHAIDILVHGSTYNRAYWNWPINTSAYSYVDNTLLSGRATFAYDNLGAGLSSHPLSSTVTVDAEAYALHQVIAWVHGQLGYGTVHVIGHSLGSIIAVDESATYHDEEALVLTGYTHGLNAAHAAATGNAFYAASSDPQFASLGLDPGYLTTVPGIRGTLFYSSIADPDIIAYDEAHKDTLPVAAPTTGTAQILAPADGNIANSVTVPVLEVLGQEDYFYCGTGSNIDCTDPAAVKAFDSPYFNHAPSLTVQVTPFSGHDLALHPTNPLTFAGINYWILAH